MLLRFYAPDLDPAQERVTLPPDESHHLVRVLRLARGDHAIVFDGRGAEFLATVESVDRQAAVVRVLEQRQPAPDPPVRIVLVQSVLKGDKMDTVIRDATMAGVAHIAPVITDRSLVKLSALARAHALERWQRVAISSAKQCGRARLPTIDKAVPFDEWLRAPFEGLRLFLVEPSTEGEEPARLRDVLPSAPPPAIGSIVGPEGGWSGDDRALAAAAGCIPASLGPMTLRADAAGLVAVAVLSFAFFASQGGSQSDR
jgi:16S rRNA (uracil1498-N3)-methyltransferase